MNINAFQRDFILLNVGSSTHNANWNWKNIHSPFARVHYVKNGTARIKRSGKTYILKKNHIYLTPSFVRQDYECDGYFESYYIHIYEDFIGKISIFDLIEFPVEVEANPIDKQLIKRLIEINPDKELKYYDPRTYDNSTTVAQNIARQKKNPLAFRVETHGIIEQILSRFLVQDVYNERHIEKRILKSLIYIHENLDRKISIDKLAEICFLSKDHFIRLFKTEMKCTPGVYINQKKIEMAQLHILIDSDCLIKDIAYGLGFDNIPYFNSLFTKITGESPGKYKRKVLQNHGTY